MKLAIAQMVLGVLIMGNYAPSLWGVYRYLPAHMPVAYLFPVVLGLAVLGCGIAQFLKARKVRIKYEATP